MDQIMLGRDVSALRVCKQYSESSWKRSERLRRMALRVMSHS